MTNWQRKVRPGDPLRIGATAYNKFVDAAIAVSGGDGTLQPTGTQDSATYILAHNVGSIAAEAWTPARIASTDPASLTRRVRRPVVLFGTGASSTPLAEPNIIVPQEIIRPGTIGRACIAGVTYCKVLKTAGGASPPAGAILGMTTGALREDSDGSAAMIGSASGIDGSTVLALVRLGVGSGTWHARIGASPEQIGSAARWRYAWTEVRWQASNSSFVDVTSGRSSGAMGRAVNLLEAGNTAAAAYSIPVAGTNFAIGNTGVLFRPVPPGAVVRMRLMPEPGTQDAVATFEAPNPVWGPCTPLAGLVGSDTSSGAQPVEGSAEQESETSQ